MPKERIAGPGNFNYHYPMLPAIVTARHEGKANAMAAAWHVPFSFTPPLYGVILSPKRHTCKLILASKEFGVNFMPLERAQLVAAVGGSTGAEVDKFQKFNILTDPPLKTSVPILKDAYAAYELRLAEQHTFGDHALLVGEIVAVHFSQEAFTDKGLNLSGVNPLSYLGGDFYATVDKGSVRYRDRQLYGKK